MSSPPRGIAPELLVSQVKNTMPYLFDPLAFEKFKLEALPAAVFMREFLGSTHQELSHFEYFKLCVCAHLLSCATPTPTDVDNQIRKKLWPKELPLEVALQMSELVLEAQSWDYTLISERYSFGAKDSEFETLVLGGHQGEWFTLAGAAYCALLQYSDPLASQRRGQIVQAISDEVRRHSEVFGSLWRANQGVDCLKASANIAHNLGDLDRVMDMWELAVNDPLRVEFYKLTAQPFNAAGKLRYLGRLWVAGELYKSEIEGSSMAFENHRHFALRKPKCLKQHRQLLIPNGPFFDRWGVEVAEILGAKEGAGSEALCEVVDALIQGWSRLPKTVGYGRALCGIFRKYPELKIEKAQELKTHRGIIETEQVRFEKKWGQKALELMDEIPARARA